MIRVMHKLLRNVRFWVLVFSVFLSVGYWWGVRQDNPDITAQILRLTQFYGLTAMAYLYTALLIGPAVYSFSWLPWRGGIYRARRAIGVSVVYFGWLHSSLAFFKQLGGFAGLPLLSARYLTAIILSFTALMILTLMASTSFDAMVARLTFRRWKLLHRFIYLAGFLILAHSLLVGTHFRDLTQPLPRVAYSLLLFLLILQARRFDSYLASFWPRVTWWQPTLIALALAAAYVAVNFIFK